MTSWLYIFSKFTPEALLFEALVIFILLAGYSAFWVIRKRKFGVAESQLPAGAVKYYLNDLILNAEQLRIQLFGLLGESAHPSMSARHSASIPETLTPQVDTAAVTGSKDPQLEKKLAEFEAKILEQTKAIQTITTEKIQIEKDLAAARAQTPSSGENDSSSQKEASAAMLRKINELEGKLAEYSVIEDDLANLKRLQQENTQLKEALARQSGASPSAAPVAETPTPETPTPESSPVVSTPPTQEEKPFPEELLSTGEVEPEEDSTTTAHSPAEAPSPESTPEKSESPEADLVAEFEKMLKG